MITKFDSLYAGHVDLENIGYGGTPINDRRLRQRAFIDRVVQSRGDGAQDGQSGL